eukprot:scaffold31_cov132-Skeletonema_menzelii.AAC.10
MIKLNSAVTCLLLSALTSGNFFKIVSAVNIRGGAIDNHSEVVRQLSSQTCPEQYCTSTRKLEEALLVPRRDQSQCDLAMVSLANYTAP